MNFIPLHASIGLAHPVSLETALPQQYLGSCTLTLPARKVLFDEGAEWAQAWEIISGHVMLTMERTGQTPVVVGILHPGDIVGLARDGHYFTSAKTLSAVHLRKVMLHDAGERVRQRINDQLCRTMQQHMRIAAMESLQRLAAFFLDWAQSTGAIENNGSESEPVDLCIPIQRAELASYLAMVGESMSRNLAKLRALKIIETPDLSTIRVLDFQQLTLLAQSKACT